MNTLNLLLVMQVHGDIRHLERKMPVPSCCCLVHGDIRHLEMDKVNFRFKDKVHGDIRHLETRDVGRH